MAPKPYILQDRRKSLFILFTLSSVSAIPNFTMGVESGFDSTSFGSIAVVNPNGSELVVTVGIFLDQGLLDASNNGVWWNQDVAVTGLPGGVTLTETQYYSGFDTWGGNGGTYGVYPDPDQTSVWTSNWGFGAGVFQKYDIATRAWMDGWFFPFDNAQPLTINDGTIVFFQDTVGNIYTFSTEGSNLNSPQRLHKVDQTTKLEIAALGYDHQHPDPGGTFANLIYGPTDWTLYTKDGSDFVAIAGGNGFGHVINLTTMTLVGSFDFDPVLHAYFPDGVWQDDNGSVYWGCHDSSDSAFIFEWDFTTSGTVGSDPKLNIVLNATVPTANYQSTPANSNAPFWRYIGGAGPATNNVIISDFTADDEGWAGDLALVNEDTGNQVAFISSAQSPAVFVTGGVDGAAANFRDNKQFAFNNTTLAAQGDTDLSFTPAQIGGVVNFIDAATLTVQGTSYNLTDICATGITTQASGGGYTDQGTWDSGVNYAVGDIVTGSDGSKYVAITTSGPSDIQGVGVADPAARTYTPNARFTNWFNWGALPVVSAGVNVGSRNPAYYTIGGMTYNENIQRAVVLGYDFVGSPAVVVYLTPATGLFLSGLITDVCLRCGLTTDDIDVSLCTDIPVDGYLLSSRVDGKSALQNPLAAYQVDCVESDYKLKFVPRGSSGSILQIPEDDLGLVADKAKLTETLPQQQELPREVDIVYVDASLDYQQGTQLAQRNSQVVTTKQVVTLQLPMVFTADKAQQIAETNLYNAWLNSKPYDINLYSMKYAIIDPTDIIEFVYQSKAYRVRVTSATLGVNYSSALSCVSEDSNAYISVATGATAQGVTTNPGQAAVAQVLFIRDLPYLSDEDASSSHTGFYWGTSAPSPNPGGVLYKSSDDTTFDSIDSSAARMNYGVCTNTLGDPPTDCWSWDDTNTLNIQLADPTWTLEGTTDSEVLDGANGLIVGNEVIQYVNAVLEIDGTYTISRLLRGRRNTEQFSTGHGAAEDAFDPTTGMKRDAAPLALIGLLRYYRDVTVGQNIVDVTSTSFTINANDLKPAFPVHIAGSRLGDDLTISWIRRTRFGGDWIDNTGAVPLNEDSEAYSIDIYNGVTVVRTIDWTGTYDGDGNPTAPYSGADQTTDFGSPQSSIAVEVYQISAQVGRGFPGSATV